ncbi:alpha/beta hydrolase-fold protein [Streptomyces sp. G-G2]|uniref:alpha/beta hydrolase n=1 Tax=Streptomyces sp. G-G2 TaxID=3046201 RepID=UPI0024B9864B|nr:alpha/beta hydrolase-fold protein [Streptomyces sp. G-G2]MDJ0384213.1 alpha/beta hydrolase-fold protein [Streptomyces sp. G-G2]
MQHDHQHQRDLATGHEPEPATGHATGHPGRAAGAGRPKRRRRLLISGSLALALTAGGGAAAYQFGLFSDIGEPMSFGRLQDTAGQVDAENAAQRDARPGVRMPTGPRAAFQRTGRLPDGTEIGRTTLAGKKSGFTGDVWVWAPKEYDDPAYAKSAFPVLIALPGGRGYPTNYWGTGPGLGLQQTVTDGATSGKSLPFLLVMPVINADTKHHFDGSDIPGEPRMGTWMADDVPDFVKANFRTFASRDGWAFMGSSSGGFGAFKHVLKYPDRFKAVIASGVDIVPDSPLWKGDTRAMDENDPEKLAEKLITAGGPDVYINFQIGTKESGRDKAEKFMRDYSKGPVHTRLQVIQDGEHNGKSYIRGMREGSLEWISKVLLPPTPDPSVTPGAPTSATPSTTPVHGPGKSPDPVSAAR